MFARHITLQLKPGLAREFPVVFEREILPLLKDRKGFLDEILLYSPESYQIVAISLWERKENAENYQREVIPRSRRFWTSTSTAFLRCGLLRHSTLHSTHWPMWPPFECTLGGGQPWPPLCSFPKFFLAFYHWSGRHPCRPWAASTRMWVRLQIRFQP
jgi:hypothetical protein